MSEAYRTAIIRAILTALLGGASTFLATWSQTDDWKVIAIATATVVVSTLAARAGMEGALDTGRQAAAKEPGSPLP